jgi:hypothetical protein
MTGTRRRTLPFVWGCTLAALAGCSPSSKAPRGAPEAAYETGDVAMSLTIQSPAFVSNSPIPKRFTGDGEDISPKLSWSGVPEGAKSLALIVDDPDAPTPEPWVHWLIYNIPATAAGLPENIAKTPTLTAPQGALQGTNSWGNAGYGGPAPPPGHGVHHYHFKLYALDAVLSVQSGLSKAQLLSATEGHVLAQGEFVGTYQR